jgi:CheY-like chemotaxis protein
MARVAPSVDASSASFSVLIADGDFGFRQLVRRSLGRRVVVVGDAADGYEVVRMAKRLRPDVVLMAVSLPAIDGPEAARRIKAERAETKVVMLTSGHEEREIPHADALLPKEEVRVGMLARPRRRRAQR